MAKVTVFTPTYNRRNRLIRLKNSLDRQTDFDFIWLIVDDGSTDDTRQIVDGFLSSKKQYEIKYVYQKNQGKHVAHNYAASVCNTELFYCVDSDDILPSNAIHAIKEIWNGVLDKNAVSGIIGLKAYFDYNIIGNKYPNSIKRATLGELYSKYEKKGDTALIWRTDIIKQYPFKVFEGENFLRENTAYDEIDKKYKLVVVNQILYLVEYCYDGLSRNATQIELKNPKGAAFYRYNEAKKAKTWYKKLGYYAGAVFYCELAGEGIKAKKSIGTFKYFLFKMLSKIMILRYKMRGIKID